MGAAALRAIPNASKAATKSARRSEVYRPGTREQIAVALSTKTPPPVLRPPQYQPPLTESIFESVSSGFSTDDPHCPPVML